MMHLILASTSPRRSELLAQIGLPFAVVPSRVDEGTPSGMPDRLVESLALAKALDVAGRVSEGVVIGADTVVAVDGQILGKPADGGEAAAMLRKLGGRSHDVYTGLAVVDAASGRRKCQHVHTVVHFRALTESEIAAYIESGEPLDKAGAYGIQGRAAVFVSGIEGCYFNVVGLPLSRLWQMLREFEHPGLP